MVLFVECMVQGYAAVLTSVSKTFYQLGHSGSLLANGHVDTVQLLLLVGALIETLLVDDGVNGNSGFTANK